MRSIVMVLLLAGLQSARSQGGFQNLGFESAILVPISGDPYGRVQFAPAFPGWNGYAGTNQQTKALLNNMFLDSTGLGLQASNSLDRIEGTYTAMIQSGYDFSGSLSQINGALSQTGLVPSDARSIQFKAMASGLFQVSLNDVPLSLVPMMSGPNYLTYGADVSTFSGTVAKLEFMPLPWSAPSPAMSVLFLDSISFSASPIPEPSVGRLSILGLGLLGWRWRKRSCP
jgi:hypothetical protein